MLLVPASQGARPFPGEVEDWQPGRRVSTDDKALSNA